MSSTRTQTEVVQHRPDDPITSKNNLTCNYSHSPSFVSFLSHTCSRALQQARPRHQTIIAAVRFKATLPLFQ